MNENKSTSKSIIIIETYTGENISPLGSIAVKVEYEEKKRVLKELVIKGSGPSLLWQDWLKELKLNWKSIFTILEKDENLSKLFKENKTIFQDNHSLLKM